MELSDIRDEVRLRAGLGAADPIFDNATLTTLVNASLRRVALANDWPWLETAGTVNTVANTATVTLPATVRKVRYMHRESREIRFRQFRTNTDWFGVFGEPQYWTEDANTTYILPTPDAVYTINYGAIVGESVLSADTDEPLIPDWAIDLLIADCTVLVARRKHDKDMEARAYAERGEAFSGAVTAIQQTTEGWTPRHTRWYTN